MRRFHLNRLEDETGISGTGRVARGIEFDDGSVIMAWNTETTSVALYRSIVDVVAIHGHNGRTIVEWMLDENFDVLPSFALESAALKYLTA